MSYLLVILLFIFSLIGYLKNRNFFSPEFISPFIWGIIILMYLLIDHQFYSLSIEVLAIVFVWNLALLVGMYSLSFFKQQRREFIAKQFNKKIIDIYYIVTLLGFLPTLYVIYQQTTLLSGDFFYKLRMVNTGLLDVEIDIGILSYVVSFAYVTYLIELVSLQKGTSKNRLIILFCINLIFAFVTMAKSTFLFLIIPSVIVLFFKMKITTPNFKLLKYFALTILFMVIIQNLRDGENKSDSKSMIYSYSFSGLPAFDKILNSRMESENFGQNTFAFFNNVIDRLSGTRKSEKKYKNDITAEGYLWIPTPTNVYTVIGPIWLDFKIGGVIIFSFIVGFISRYFYQLGSSNYYWAIIIYSYLFCVLCLQFFGEYIYTNFSYFMQLVILTYLPYKFRNTKFTIS